MDNAFQYMDIIFLAVVAGVVLLRLRSVLGKRTGSEKKDPNLYSYDEPANQSTDTPKPVQMQSSTNNSKMDWFDNDNFIAGAKGAYETIVTNFENDNIKSFSSKSWSQHLNVNLKAPAYLIKEFAKNIFVFGQCMEGTQFYGLFGMILSLARQNKFPGVGQMFRYTLRDESNHIELFRNLFRVLVDENPDVWTQEFKQELTDLMKEAVELEKEFIRDCLPVNSVGLSSDEFCSYIDFIADRRLNGIGLDVLHPGLENPFPWLAETMDVKKEQNFFEGRVTEYQKSSALSEVSDDEL